jgi:hypothetical protein
MLPGLSAKGAMLAANVVTWVGLALVLGVPIAGALIFRDLRALIVLLVLFALCSLGTWWCFAAAIAKEHAETNAGYTTYPKQYDQLDYIDPRTRLVVRPGICLPTPSDLEEISAISPYSPVPSVLRWGSTARARRRELQSRLDDAGVFSVYMGASAGRVVAELLKSTSSVRGTRTSTSYLVGDTHHLALWGRRGREYVAYLVIPRARVKLAHVELSAYGSGGGALLVLSILKNTGTTYDLKLTPSIGGIGTPLNMGKPTEPATAWIKQWVSGANPALID